MVETIVTVAWFGLVYYIGRRVGFRRGHDEAMRHCRYSFVQQLHVRKQLLDNTLRSSMVSPIGELELTLDGEMVVKGTLQDAAKRSLEIGELIKTIDDVVPA